MTGFSERRSGRHAKKLPRECFIAFVIEDVFQPNKIPSCPVFGGKPKSQAGHQQPPCGINSD